MGLREVYGLRRNVNRKPRGADGMRVYGLRVNRAALEILKKGPGGFIGAFRVLVRFEFFTKLGEVVR